ncbi:MAG: tRNA (adenosine(37)-N6)-threonylcarbamoyltransferase complex dimerization subunit type 1 TsaB [Gordonia sp. (in: high G+C Gram-positive bacteria)]|uniref:tRNA (adenosine(37)-N6)-threonylcarbamoyltransferase complex dimerization subunit type 1 TsaB n=1 Tax=Gordonia sp. (in: high G+C Gram-positive bacteria) TaxID=84139 RepID=UPI0039E29AE3
MKILAIDTATPAVVTGAVDLSPDQTPVAVAERVVHDHRRHAEVLTTLMAEVLAEAGWTGADLDAVVVGCGPGPFTGLRVGMATAAAYADALAVPVHGVCSLDAVAAAVEADGGERPLLVVTDARRREVYWARYTAGTRSAGPDVCAPDAVDPAGAVLVAGTPGFSDRYGLPVSPVEVPTAASLVTAAAGALRAGTAPEPLTPLYLRRPDAVELKDQRRKSLLPEK